MVEFENAFRITLCMLYIQSNLGYPNADYPNLLGYSNTMDSPDFFLYYLLQLNYQLFEFRLSEKLNCSK